MHVAPHVFCCAVLCRFTRRELLVIAHTYAPARKCIYCGALTYRPSFKGTLAREHIVPESLCGQLIIPEASCRRCEEITGNTEQLALQGVYRHLRYSLNYPSKKPTKRQARLPIFIPNENKPDEKMLIETENYPSAPFFLGLGQAGLFAGIPEEFDNAPTRRWNRVLVKASGEKPNINNLGISSFATPSLDFYSFIRMIAKIGHCYAWAELAGNFRPLLFDAIIKKSKSLFHYVGGLPIPADNTQNALDDPYTISLNYVSVGDRKFAAVRIRVFANVNGSHEYYVIAGEL
ncbi:MAG: hypothetical protein HZB28_05070 [Methylocystis sp.]|nr:hypothetical protein [Methylocystis sp.]